MQVFVMNSTQTQRPVSNFTILPQVALVCVCAYIRVRAYVCLRVLVDVCAWESGVQTGLFGAAPILSSLSR